MYIKWITVLVLLIQTFTMSGQRFVGALTAGGNLSQIDGDKLGGYHQFGFNGGVKVNTVFSDRWQLSLEMLFSQKGSRRTLYDDPASAFDVIRINMVEVPVQVTFVEWKFHVNAGLSYQRLISSRILDASGANVTDLIDLSDNSLNMVFGIIYWSGEHMGYNLRWSRSLTNLRQDDKAGTFTGRTITLRVMYQF